MVTIEIYGANVKIKVIGIHRLWAFKKEIIFTKKNIIQAKIADKTLRPAPIRMPGVYIPGFIAAGTFYGNKRKEFWDINFKKEAIEIDLRNEKYTKIVVNVLNIPEVMKFLQE
jgi:hypothetical protein